MKFLIAGGDARLVWLANALAEAGNEVLAFAMDNAPLSEAIHKTDAPEIADCVILPLPAESDRLGTLNAPYSGKQLSASGLIESLREGSLVIGGKITPRLRETAVGRGVTLIDCMLRPEFTVGNANLTAEGAVSIIMKETPFALSDCRALVVGYGRIGKLLAQKLRALGAEVWVMSRNSESRAMAEALGLKAMPPAGDVSAFDAVINTAPAAVLTELAALKSTCLLLELASAPGGIDPREAERLGLKYIAAPGLPGKYAPKTAAKLIREAMENILKERGIHD